MRSIAALMLVIVVAMLVWVVVHKRGTYHALIPTMRARDQVDPPTQKTFFGCRVLFYVDKLFQHGIKRLPASWASDMACRICRVINHAR